MDYSDEQRNKHIGDVERPHEVQMPPRDSIEPDNSDNDSVASCGSGDSEMEEFEDYRTKIETLLSDFGLSGFCVEEIQHGYTFENCVYALTSSSNDIEKYILRVPVCPMQEGGPDDKCEVIRNDAALLESISDKLPVPRVKAYSVTNDNILEKPFSVQTRLPGQSLNKVFSSLSYPEKTAMVDQYVELLAKLESIQYPTAGMFTASPALLDNSSDFFIATAPLVRPFDAGEEEYAKLSQTKMDRAGSDLKTFLASHVNGHIQEELKSDNGYPSVLLESYQQTLLMLDDMENEGFFKAQPVPIVLHHWDLQARNIMVEQRNGAWEICGIIDWDDAHALPRPLARRPPDFFWDFQGGDFEG